MDRLEFSYQHLEQVMFFSGRQLDDPGDVSLREGTVEDAGEIERLGRQHLGDLQSPASLIQTRMRAGYEKSCVAEDKESSRLRGYLRWWVLNQQGVKQILDGHALTGRDLRDSDLSFTDAPPPPGGALYLAMLLGTDTVSCLRVMEAATRLVSHFEQRDLPTFTRPTTPDGFRLVEPPHRGFERVPQQGSFIYIRRPRRS
jgi:hypothetical protein